MKPCGISAPQTLFHWEEGDIWDFSERWLHSAPSHHHTVAYGSLNQVVSYLAQMLDMEPAIV